nr:thiamine phosphate synthase [Oceanococcus sp. HetDA_MAG_MS8]
MTPQSRLQVQGLYLLVDPEVLPAKQWMRVLPQVLAQPWALVQLRAKIGDATQQLSWANNLAAMCREYARPLLINDRVDLALACKAQGVHLGQSDGSLQAARQALGPQAIIGRTAHADLALVEEAAQDGADYASIGAIFASGTKPQAKPASLALLRQATQTQRIPICAIGGINTQNLDAVLDCQPALIAVCGAVLSAANPGQQAADLMRSLRHD